MKKIMEKETYEYMGEGWMIMEVVKICKCVEVKGKMIEVVGIWKHIEKVEKWIVEETYRCKEKGVMNIMVAEIYILRDVEKI